MNLSVWINVNLSSLVPNLSSWILSGWILPGLINVNLSGLILSGWNNENMSGWIGMNLVGLM